MYFFCCLLLSGRYGFEMFSENVDQNLSLTRKHSDNFLANTILLHYNLHLQEELRMSLSNSCRGDPTDTPFIFHFVPLVVGVRGAPAVFGCHTCPTSFGTSLSVYLSWHCTFPGIMLRQSKSLQGVKCGKKIWFKSQPHGSSGRTYLWLSKTHWWVYGVERKSSG